DPAWRLMPPAVFVPVFLMIALFVSVTAPPKLAKPPPSAAELLPTVLASTVSVPSLLMPPPADWPPLPVTTVRLTFRTPPLFAIPPPELRPPAFEAVLFDTTQSAMVRLVLGMAIVPPAVFATPRSTPPPRESTNAMPTVWPLWIVTPLIAT